MTPLVCHYLRMYRRATRFRALPEPGGLEDQPERTMRILDVIAEEEREAVAEHDAAEQRRLAAAEARRRKIMRH